MLNIDLVHNYQWSACDHIINCPYSGLFMDMGLGKTVSTLTAIQYLMYEELEISKVLVIGTKRVAENVWHTEVKKWGHLKNLRVVRVMGNPKQRKAALKEKADIYAIGRDNVAWLCALYGGSKLPFDMLVVDESSSFKNQDSVRFKALKRTLAHFDRRVILTGTPSPNSLLDLWSQLYLVDLGTRLGRFISDYRDKYFRVGARSGAIVYNYNLKLQAEKKIYRRIKDVCVSMKKEDYLDMPDRVDNFVRIELPKSVKDRYNEFEKEQVLQIFEYEDDENDISAANAAALSNKLLQFANGAVYYEEDEENKSGKRDYHTVHSLKLDALEEILESAQGKPVLVAYAFKHGLERIMKRFKHLDPVQLKTSKHIDAWNRGEIKLMVTHPASSAHGLNLQEGGHIFVWFGLTWSLEFYQQAIARLHRQGQINVVIVHHLIASGTLDDKVIKALARKDETQSDLMAAVKHAIKKYKKSIQAA